MVNPLHPEAAAELARAKAKADAEKAATANGHDPEPDISQEIERLSRLNPLDYAIARKAEAKRLGLLLPMLDMAVQRVRGKLASEADGFQRNEETGELLRNEYNMLLAFKKLGVQLAFNEFTGRFHIGGLKGFGPLLDDGALDELFLTVAREYDLKLAERDFDRIVRAKGRRKRFHPVRMYLSDLQWDGIDRIGEWLHAYFGAENTKLNRAIGRIMLIAAVRRVRQPGCKFDTMLVLEGKQGAGKSRSLRALCPDPDWFTDSVTLHNSIKENMELTGGKWIVEIGELVGLGKATAGALKSTLSRQTDSARKAYGREPTDQHRQCVYIGTTNEENYLTDDTGNRRFLPVKIKQVDVDGIARDRDQLWAEAAYYEAQGEAIFLPPKLMEEAKAAQRKRGDRDEWEWPIAKHLVTQERTTILEVASGALQMEKARFDSRAEKQISRCMKKLGWKMTDRSHGKRYWTHPDIQKFRAEVVEIEKEDAGKSTK